MTTASIISGVNLLVLNVPPPVEEDGVTLRDDLLGLKVWYSLTPNFNELTQGTLAYNGAGLSATIAGLTPNIDYYIKYALISDIDPDVYDISEELTAQAISRDVVADPTPPPTPINVSVSAGITSIIISHDTPEYTIGGGHRRTLVYGKIRTPGAALPTYEDSDIRVVVEFTGATTSFVTEPGTTWHLWLKWLSNDGVLSELPSGGVNGHVATTGQDVSKLLEVLTGEITETQLYSTLTSRINLIDDPTTGLVKKTDDLIDIYGSTASAAANAASAAQSAADAIIAKGVAEGSASTATTQAGLATTAKDAAAGSATSASQSASAAATSATNAAGSASTATTQAGLATTAKNDAAGSATSASTSATNAATSATNAAGSASTATTQAGLATTAKDAAAGSATSASQSASAAATSATNAAGSASTATTQASLATTAKNDAATSATNASQSATAAATSATNAAGSASTATTQASLATTAKNDASGFATNAGVSATNAATSATNAAGSASSAATSETNVKAIVRGTSLGLPLEQWTLNGQTIVALSDGAVGTNALRLSGNFGYPNQGNYVPLDATKKYRVKFWARPSSTAAGTLYFSLRQFLDSSGTAGPVNGGRSPYKPSGQSRAQHLATYGNTWGEYNYTWTSADWQAGVKFIQPEFLDNYSGQAGHWDVQGFTFTDVTETEEVSAAVQTLATTVAGPNGATAQFTVKTDVAGHVAGFGLSSASNAAGAATSSFGITADRFFVAPPAISSATAPSVNLYNGFTWVDTSVSPPVTRYRSGTSWVTTPPVLPFVVQASPVIGTGTTQNPQIPAGVYIDAAFIRNATITTAKIADLAVDNAKIADLAVDNAKIANLAVDNAKIADLAVDNAKIANLNADKITAGFIRADRIAANSITAEKINTNGLEVRDTDGKLLLGSGGLTMGTGTNLQVNSLMNDSLQGWQSYINTPGGYTGTLTRIFNANGAPSGYGSALLSINTGAVQTGFDSSIYWGGVRTPCTPGERLELQAKVQVFRGDAQLQVTFFNSSNAPVAFTPVSGGVSDAIGDTAWSQNLTEFVHLWGFVTVPANAASFYIEIRTRRTNTTLATQLYVTQPYIGRATAAQTTPTQWANGDTIITSANASTYIANAAIGDAQINNLNADKITTGTISADRLDSATITGKVANLQSAQIGLAQINTLNLAGNSVTTHASASGQGPVSTTITIPPNTNGDIVAMVYFQGLALYRYFYALDTPVTAKLQIANQILETGLTITSTTDELGATTSVVGSTLVSRATLGPGTHTITASTTMIPAFGFEPINLGLVTTLAAFSSWR